jgi:DNA-binding response OmpR family regulator
MSSRTTKTAIPDRKKEIPDSILIIENDTASREELAAALAKAGFAVAIVPDYPAALLKLNYFKANLVIVDAVLPSIDGREACRQIGSTLDIPVVLLSGDNSDEAWEKASQANIDLYQTKPFNYRILVAMVKATLRRYKARWQHTQNQGC